MIKDYYYSSVYKEFLAETLHNPLNLEIVCVIFLFFFPYICMIFLEYAVSKSWCLKFWVKFSERIKKSICLLMFFLEDFSILFQVLAALGHVVQSFWCYRLIYRINKTRIVEYIHCQSEANVLSFNTLITYLSSLFLSLYYHALAYAICLAITEHLFRIYIFVFINTLCFCLIKKHKLHSRC